MLLETLYEPIPDVDAYLERIHMDMPILLNKETLDRIIYLHQCAIPFENLDVYFAKKEIQQGISDVFDKIIRNKRGGFCFEMNNLFHAFLKTVGFDVYPCLCKVIEGPPPYYPALHRGTIARLDGTLHYCDIGFGGPVPGGAIRIEEGTVQTFASDSYRMHLREDGWWELRRLTDTGKDNIMLRIQTLPYDPADFIALCHYCCCHTQQDFNHFTDELLLNIRTKNGYASITNDVMKIKENGIVTETRITDREQLLYALHRVFLLPDHVAELIPEFPSIFRDAHCKEG